MNNARPASCSRRGSAAGAWRERLRAEAVFGIRDMAKLEGGTDGELDKELKNRRMNAGRRCPTVCGRETPLLPMAPPPRLEKAYSESAPSIPPTIAPTGGEVLVTADVDGDNAFDVEVEKDVNEDKDADDEEEEEDDDDDDDEPAEGSECRTSVKTKQSIKQDRRQCQ
ncbi:hypothetical protein JR316_0008432 [Psilocybe cubensis]|uniref:Uncharacterized protein n=1 Tax=Psilocybe cubensis TaxID=181762 RepID=A0ACB8GWM4_PSICU|nr:hypothetical protein JR316_0008432 [Psilocybe cubensis]KAH9479837.1 hypothetical protein JR316_0008432 [Psilocybe cubensis]